MAKIGIFYGTTTGVTKEIAEKIAKAMGVAQDDVMNVSESAPSSVGKYDMLIFGCSTWGNGDMQDDMHDFLDGVGSLDLRDKTVALFGCGDESMSMTFCDGVGEMYEMLKRSGCRFVGRFNVEGFEFEHSKAVDGDEAVGLLIDENNHADITDRRIADWCITIK